MVILKKSASKKVLFSAVTFFIFFLGVEGTLRLAGIPSEPPPASPIQFQQVPSPVITPEPAFRQSRLSIYVDRRVRIENPKPKDAFRVFTLGGSAALGMGFPHNGSFSRWLERMLAMAYPHRGSEVINMGSVGFSSEQERAVLQEILDKGEPDLLIVYSGHNEFLDIKARKAMEQVNRRRAAQANHWLGRNLAAARFIKMLLPSGKRMAEEEQHILSEYLSIKPDPNELPLGYTRFESNLRAMAQAAKARNVPIIFCTVLANPFYFFPELVLFGADLEQHPRGHDIYQAGGWAKLHRWDKARGLLSGLSFAGNKVDLLRVYEAGGIRGMDRLTEAAAREMMDSARNIISEREGRTIKGDEDYYSLAISYKLLGDEPKLLKTLNEANESLKNEKNSDNRALRRVLYAQFQGDDAFHRAFMELWSDDRTLRWASPRVNDIVRSVAASEGLLLADIERGLPDWMDPTPAHYLLDYCHLNIEGNFEVARLLFETAKSRGLLPESPLAADFRSSLLEPDLDWLRTKACDFLERDKYMGLDFRVCFVYCPPYPDKTAYARWAGEDVLKEPDKEIVRAFAENRRYFEQ